MGLFEPLADAQLDEDFAADVRAGLSARPKQLPCKYFYDAEGSRIFEEICALPEYYVTRAEREILDRHAPAIARRVARGTTLVELGSGSAVKTQLVIDALLAAQGRLRYVPVDVSQSMLAESSASLCASRPSLTVTPVAAEYEAALRLPLLAQSPKLVLWLGSSIGNFHPADALAFVRAVREIVTGDDRFLLGVDLRKSREVLERAYDDARGVTARFNLNLLHRINRELGGHFDVARFRHRAHWDAQAGCVSMHLESTVAQRVAIDALGLTVDFAEGETIHTENSYKYSPAEIDELARAAGFSIEERWLDGDARFSLSLLAPALH